MELVHAASALTSALTGNGTVPENTPLLWRCRKPHRAGASLCSRQPAADTAPRQPEATPEKSMPLIVALDFETADYKPDSACAIGLARVRLPELPERVGQPEQAGQAEQGEADSRDTPDPVYTDDAAKPFSDARLDGSFYSLIRPPSSRVRFSEIHGLTWPMLKDAPTFAQIWPEIAAFIADADFLAAHNAPFDRKVLYASCEKIGVPAPAAPFLCTLKGARRALGLASHTLNAVCSHCAIPLTHHHAGSDALASAAILLHLHDLGLDFASMLSGMRPQGPLRRHTA